MPSRVEMTLNGNYHKFFEMYQFFICPNFGKSHFALEFPYRLLILQKDYTYPLDNANPPWAYPTPE